MSLSWSRHVEAGQRDETTIGQGVDLMPTLAHVAGIKPPTGGSGIDLSPVLGGQVVAKRPPTFWAFGMPGAQRPPRGPFAAHDVAPGLAVRDGRWKLFAEADGRKVQLCDLDADPSETNDLAARQPRIRDRLSRKLEAWADRLHPIVSGG